MKKQLPREIMRARYNFRILKFLPIEQITSKSAAQTPDDVLLLDVLLHRLGALLCHSTGWKTEPATQMLRERAATMRVAPLNPYACCRKVISGGPINWAEETPPIRMAFARPRSRLK